MRKIFLHDSNSIKSRNRQRKSKRDFSVHLKPSLCDGYKQVNQLRGTVRFVQEAATAAILTKKSLNKNFLMKIVLAYFEDSRS